MGSWRERGWQRSPRTQPGRARRRKASFSAPSAVPEPGAVGETGVRAARGVLASSPVRSPETQRGPRPPFLSHRAGPSGGPTSQRRPSRARFPGVPRPPGQALGCVNKRFQNPSFQSHSEKWSEESFTLDSNMPQHACCFSPNSIIAINN